VFSESDGSLRVQSAPRSASPLWVIPCISAPPRLCVFWKARHPAPTLGAILIWRQRQGQESATAAEGGRDRRRRQGQRWSWTPSLSSAAAI
jgi:hypothetical protein